MKKLRLSKNIITILFMSILTIFIFSCSSLNNKTIEKVAEKNDSDINEELKENDSKSEDSITNDEDTNDDFESEDDKLIKKIRSEIELMDFDIDEDVKVELSQGEYHSKVTSDFNSGDKLLPISMVSVGSENKNYRKLSLTFDSSDKPAETKIDIILDLLDEYDFKATFFMTYEFMSKNYEDVIKVVKRGHEIANHSATHKSFDEISDDEIVREILIPHYFVKELTGIDMCLFRFPYGAYSNRAIELLTKLGYYPIQWAADSIDWKGESADIIYDRLVNSNKLFSGSIVLFHIWPANTPEVLPSFFEYLKNNNLSSIKVSDLIIKDDFKIVWGKQYSN